MNVITLASRKGGAGKSTLTAQLAAQCHISGKRTLIIDADPQGSLSLWHSLRKDGLPKLVTPERGIERAVAFAMIDDFEYVFIDTAPTMWVVVQEAIRAATLTLIPARPGLLRSCGGARDREGRARARLPLCGGDQRGAGEARRQGGWPGRAVASLFRRAADPGVGRTDQPARGLPVDARRRRERRRDRPEHRGRYRDRQALGRGREERRGDQQRAVRAGRTGERVDESEWTSAPPEPGTSRGACHRQMAATSISVPPYSHRTSKPGHCRRMCAIGYRMGRICSPRDSLPVAGRRPCFQRNKRKPGGIAKKRKPGG